MGFSKDTFKYLDLALKNSDKPAWFKKNEELYKENVKAPMGEILIKLWEKYDDKLPGIVISPKKVSRAVSKGEVKPQTSFFLAEKPTSRFEWNPGFYFQLGTDKDSNLLGVGLYMVSSRQMKMMRRTLSQNYKEFEAILKNPKLKNRFGDLTGDRYTRFPKDYDENAPYAKYLWHKQFFLSRHYTRTEVLKKNFPQELMKDFEAAMPFFIWIREKVGVYKPASGKSSFMMDDDF